jgi:hypothetical protein
MSYEDFLKAGMEVRGMNPGSIKDIYLREGRLVTELAYEFQELVSPGRDVIFSFYIPSNTTKLNFLKMNLYFPGIQLSDHPENSPIMYLPYVNKGGPSYKNGAFDSFDQLYFSAGTGADGVNYWWGRAFVKFNISPLRGFKLSVCKFKWLLASKAFAGSGPNAQLSMYLDGLDDYGTLDKDDWEMAREVDYGIVNVYTDPVGVIYEKDIKTWIQSRIDAGENYAAFRFLTPSPTDPNNANNYRLDEPLIYCELEEDTDQEVEFFVNNGPGFGNKLTSFKTDKEEFDLTKYFSGTGKKQIKFSASRMRRIEVLVRIRLKLSGGSK